MTLTQLRYLAAIIDAGFNITEAASRLNATQPGVSKQLKQMEDELGFQIFVRRGKSLEGLSPAGAKVVERARVILSETANIRALAADHRNEARGELAVATTYTQARFVLPATLARLRTLHPGIDVRLNPHSEAEALALLGAGAVDAAVVSSPDRPAATGVVAGPVYRWSLAALAPRRHPLAAASRPPTLREIAGHPLVTYASAQRPDSSLARAFAAAGRAPRLACATRDAEVIKTCVRAGMGLGLLAEMAVAEADAADLAVLDVDGLFPLNTTWVVLRRGHVLRGYVHDWLADLVPHVGRRDLRAAMEGGAEPWIEPPHWREVRGRFQLEAEPRSGLHPARNVVPFEIAQPPARAAERLAVSCG